MLSYSYTCTLHWYCGDPQDQQGSNKSFLPTCRLFQGFWDLYSCWVTPTLLSFIRESHISVSSTATIVAFAISSLQKSWNSSPHPPCHCGCSHFYQTGIALFYHFWGFSLPRAIISYISSFMGIIVFILEPQIMSASDFIFHCSALCHNTAILNTM